MSNILLSLESVSKVYGNEGEPRIEVLKNFSVNIHKGARVAVTGPSGAGKSTLLHIMGGLDYPSKGTVYFESRNIYQMTATELDLYRNRNVGFVFQFHYLLEDFTARENVMIPALLAGRNNEEASLRAEKLLNHVGLEHRIDHLPKEMSGGEQQRVAVARALMNNPKIILADEPTGSLDKDNSEVVEQLLLNLREQGVTVIIVTHDIKLAEKCDDIILLEKA